MVRMAAVARRDLAATPVLVLMVLRRRRVMSLLLPVVAPNVMVVAERDAIY